MKFDDVFAAVLAVADRFGVRADNHEEFFDSILEDYRGDSAGLERWLSERIPRLFSVLGDRPVWIQEEDWPTTSDGHPLTFVGQFNVSSGTLPAFHDDVAFYVFVDPASGESEIVLQEA